MSRKLLESSIFIRILIFFVTVIIFIAIFVFSKKKEVSNSLRIKVTYVDENYLNIDSSNKVIELYGIKNTP